MSRENVTFDWLIATCPKGFMRGSSAANHPSTTESFTVAHERAGHTVTRLTYEQARDRLKACRAPARELYYAPREVLSIPEAETAADPLPPIGETVQGPWGVGTVIAHLRWSDTHPTRAGRTAAHLRGPGGEGLAYPGEARPYRTPAPAPEPPASLPPSPPPAALPRPVQPSLF